MPIPLPASVGDVSQGSPISLGSIGDVGMHTDIQRELNAGAIGLIVVGIFGIATIYLFHLAGLLFTKFNATDIKDFSTFVTGSLDPFLKECATTLGTIFGSTLGFVFGYYFKATSASQSAKS